MNYKIGSMWRKWDLHTHTMYSYLNDQFGNDFEKYVHDLFVKAVDLNVYAIGITDYYSIKGYTEIKKILNNKKQLENIFRSEISKESNYVEKINQIALFPNIELRSNNSFEIIGRNSNSKVDSLEFHVIFDNNVPIEDIEDCFIRRVTFSSCGKNYSLEERSIESFGKEYKKKNPGLNESDKDVGYKHISLDFKDVIKTLKSEERFKEKYIVVGVKDGINRCSFDCHAGTFRMEYLSDCDAYFSRNQKDINWLQSEECLNMIGKRIPCISGADAHSFDELFMPADDKFCWFKADTTFEGLKIALQNSKERIYIGQIPPELAAASKRKAYSVSSVKVSKKDKCDKEWFSMPEPLELNPYMVSIIGNKGSGKSALADIIATICNAKTIGDASFLNVSRFMKGPDYYHKHFKGELSFCDSPEKYISKDVLDNKYDPNKSAKVTYLPQSYIEKMCNEMNGDFQNEIDKVIFSYIPPQNKRGANNLNELIDIRIDSYKDEIKELKNRLSLINKRIIDLEDKKQDGYRHSVEKRIESLEFRLNNHINSKPEAVEKPKDFKNTKEFVIENVLKDLIKKNEELIENTQKEYSSNENAIATIEVIKKKTERAVELIEEINVSVQGLKIIKDDNKYFNFTKDDNLIENLYKHFEDIKSKSDVLLSEDSIVSNSITVPELNIEDVDENKIIGIIDSYKSLKEKRFVLNELHNKISLNYNFENRKYSEYIVALEKWDKERQIILGDIPNQKDGESIKKYKCELNYIDNNLEADYDAAKKERKEIVTKIYDKYTQIRDVYNDIYNPIQSKIDSAFNNDAAEKISFLVTIKTANCLGTEILSHVKLGVSSYYKGSEEGLEKLNAEINKTNFYDSKSTISFIEGVYSNLLKAKDFSAFFKSVEHREMLYNYIGGLDYISINYSLSLGGKMLDSLSPGERGIVLLVFNLALVDSDIPLIIDQPEDNLDNESVYTRLVPCLKKAKKNRQIIVVTHNPNIAVACDSEQIIYSKMDKNNCHIEYESGAIEDNAIKQKVINVLEGTAPAFNFRKNRYGQDCIE